MFRGWGCSPLVETAKMRTPLSPHSLMSTGLAVCVPFYLHTFLQGADTLCILSLFNCKRTLGDREEVKVYFLPNARNFLEAL